MQDVFDASSKDNHTFQKKGVQPDAVQPLDADTVVAELLSKDYVTRGVAIGGSIYTIKTFTGIEYSMFTRLFNHRLDSFTSTPRAVLVEQLRTECMLPFILKEKDGQPISPVTDELKNAWVQIDTTGKCSYLDRTFTDTREFFKEVYSSFVATKLHNLPTVVVGILAEEYNALIKEVESLLRGDNLKN